jgi:hypothetical protein
MSDFCGGWHFVDRLCGEGRGRGWGSIAGCLLSIQW